MKIIIFNNQSAFIFVNYNILLEAPGSERKATGLAKVKVPRNRPEGPEGG
jgi:hypothetical protein